jgi:hypothetical protein
MSDMASYLHSHLFSPLRTYSSMADDFQRSSTMISDLGYLSSPCGWPGQPQRTSKVSRAATEGLKHPLLDMSMFTYSQH